MLGKKCVWKGGGLRAGLECRGVNTRQRSYEKGCCSLEQSRDGSSVRGLEEDGQVKYEVGLERKGREGVGLGIMSVLIGW